MTEIKILQGNTGFVNTVGPRNLGAQGRLIIGTLI